MDVQDVFNKLDKTVDTYKKTKEGYHFLKDSYRFYKSPERAYEIQKAERSNKICYIIFVLFCILWLSEIIATIVLCIQNNDVILRLFNL